MVRKQPKVAYTFSGVLLIFLIFLIYSNTLQSPWILDDFHNIINNPRIQISSLSLETITNTFFSSQTYPERLYRPLSCVTFALNALMSGKNVFTYHLVNISLHAATTLILMWLLILVFQTPALRNTPEKEKQFIIVLATVLWAVNPIQIQAVTYIVQRMAMLSALFSLLSLGCFLKARMTDSQKWKVFYYFCCIAGIVCAFLSKENGIVTLPLIITLEYYLFRNGDYKILAKKEFLIAISSFFILCIGYLAYSNIFTNFLLSYAERPFSLYERLLTQPKILLYYLSLIFYPTPQRFSL